MKANKAVLVFGTALSLVLGSGLVARAVEVTFQVNMAVQTAVQDFYPGFDTVELHGSFDGWGPGITLVQSQTDSDLYEGTVDLGSPGTVVDYKYVIHQEDEVIVWEVDGVGEGGAQNRWVDVPDAPLTLAAVFFDNETTLPGNVAVTFQVNLSIQQLIGNFDPTSHTVEVRGSFDGWGAGIALAVDPMDSDIYQGTTDILGSAGAVIEYKFVINQAGTLVWEGDVGTGMANRAFTLEGASQTLPVVYFDNLSTDPGAGIPVTFAVNLGVQAALGLFNPDFDTVTVAGKFNVWNGTDSPLVNSNEEPYIYRGMYSIKASPGSPVPHKFVVSGSVWEEGDDRTFVLADSEQTLPVVFFNRQDNLGAVAVTSMSDGEIALEWTAASGIRLETSSNLDSGWQDVPGTTGQGSATVPVGSSNGFFRLTGP